MIAGDLEDHGYVHEFLLASALRTLTHELESGEIVHYEAGAMPPTTAKRTCVVCGLVGGDPVLFQTGKDELERLISTVLAFETANGPGWQVWCHFHSDELFVRFVANSELVLPGLQSSLKEAMACLTTAEIDIRVVRAPGGAA
jgi:hypothetical protein